MGRFNFVWFEDAVDSVFSFVDPVFSFAIGVNGSDTFLGGTNFFRNEVDEINEDVDRILFFLIRILKCVLFFPSSFVMSFLFFSEFQIFQIFPKKTRKKQKMVVIPMEKKLARCLRFKKLMLLCISYLIREESAFFFL